MTSEGDLKPGLRAWPTGCRAHPPHIGVHMNYLSSMPLSFHDEIDRLLKAQAETIEALDEATESGDQQFAEAATSHLEFLTKELDRLWDER